MQPALIVRQQNPWLAVAPVVAARDSRADGAARLEIEACRNENACAALLLINTSTNALDLRLEVGALTAENGSPRISAPKIEIREVCFVKDMASGEILADPIVALNEINKMTIPPGNSRQIWLNLDTRDVAPDRYAGQLAFISLLGDFPPHMIALRLSVWPLILPDQVPLSVYTFDRYQVNYGAARATPLAGKPEDLDLPEFLKAQEAYTRQLAQAGVNVFNIESWLLPWPECDNRGNLLRPLDFRVMDEVVRLKRKYGRLIFESTLTWGVSMPQRLGRNKFSFMGEEWKQAFGSWLRQFVAHLKNEKLDYGDYAFYFMAIDGFDPQVIERLVALNAFIRQIDPDLRLFVDYGWTDPECRVPQFVPVMEKIRPGIDILAPNIFRLESDVDLAFCNKFARTNIWPFFSSPYTYDKPAVHYASRTLDPYSVYRLLFWKVWNYGFGGCGCCSSTSWFKHTWDFTAWDSGALYSTPQGLVTSKRWEAFRAGYTDYKYLYLLSRAIADAGGETEALLSAKKLLAEAVRAVLAAKHDPAVADQYRRKIAAQLLELGAARERMGLSGSCLPPPPQAPYPSGTAMKNKRILYPFHKLATDDTD